MTDQHHYLATIKWTGNTGKGTLNYKAFTRDHEISIKGKPTILASSDPAFLGDPARHNPEDLFLASLSECHMLWYLHFCSVSGIVVTAYEDNAEGIMVTKKSGEGQFESVTLNLRVTIANGGDVYLAKSLHHKAHEFCFIARSVNFPVNCEDKVEVEG